MQDVIFKKWINYMHVLGCITITLLGWSESGQCGYCHLKRIPFKQLHRFTYLEPFDDLTVAGFPHYWEACPWPCNPAKRGLYGDHNLATQSKHSHRFSWWIHAKVQFISKNMIKKRSFSLCFPPKSILMWNHLKHSAADNEQLILHV